MEMGVSARDGLAMVRIRNLFLTALQIVGWPLTARAVFSMIEARLATGAAAFSRLAMITYPCRQG